MSFDPGPGFRDLHQPGNPFILANAWDIGSARMLAALGAKAIGTSSAAHAFTLGLPDTKISRDQALEHAQILVSATSLPVSADLEDGFGEAPETCAETVRLAEETGVAGLSIEDFDAESGQAYPRDLAIERIRAAAAAARTLPRDIFLLARADGVMNGVYNLDEAIARLQGYHDAGADGVYVPVAGDMTALTRVVAATPLPVNVLAAGAMTAPTLSEFAKAGVARISLGSSLARLTHQAIFDAGQTMFEHGDFSPLGNGASGDTIDTLLNKGAGS